MDLQDIGTVHTRLITSNQLEPDLARAEVAKGSPTIWVTVKLEIASWPFRVENESDCAVEFWQTVRSSSAADSGVLTNLSLSG